MTEKREIWKCDICGNIIEVLHEGSNSLVCCGKPMKNLLEKTKDIGKEKHIPIIEKNKDGIKISVSTIAHPMTSEHYIEWIEIYTEKGYSRKFLKHSDKPEAVFPIKTNKKLSARIYCNIHELWRSE